MVKLVVIGGSAGAVEALSLLLPQLPPRPGWPVVMVQHLHRWQENPITAVYQPHTALPVHEAEDKTPLQPNHIYFAPPNYHLLINDDATLALSIDPKVNFARPSIDVLFESAVDTYGGGVVGVLLTGANQDGTVGLKRIKQAGGIVLVQDPTTAVAPTMPQHAIDNLEVDFVLPVAQLGQQLATFAHTH
jgi:two-component system, chemotaxis family, protein-glutamate methylesterase/glutaminase